MNFPPAIPEMPVASIAAAAAYYVDKLGFTLDWGDEVGGIAGLSRGDCRLFLTNDVFRNGTAGRVVIWLNVSGKSEVDTLHAEWEGTGAMLKSGPEDKPWKLREFTAIDLDGNILRVFYEFSRD